jgi:hypothetical protein
MAGANANGMEAEAKRSSAVVVLAAVRNVRHHRIGGLAGSATSQRRDVKVPPIFAWPGVAYLIIAMLVGIIASHLAGTWLGG